MFRCQFRSKTPRPKSTARYLLLAFACGVLLSFAVSSAPAQQLAPNQTHGFGNGPLVTFTYLQNFDCVEEPTMDLDFNGVKAQSDPNELQTPICQVVTEPSADPTGGSIKHTAHLYVFVPMFSVDNDQNPADAMPCPNGGRPGELCGIALGQQLIKLFGFVPEAWKTKVNPAITTQCPDPNNPVPGTCTMHASSVDSHGSAQSNPASASSLPAIGPASGTIAFPRRSSQKNRLSRFNVSLSNGQTGSHDSQECRGEK